MFTERHQSSLHDDCLSHSHDHSHPLMDMGQESRLTSINSIMQQNFRSIECTCHCEGYVIVYISTNADDYGPENWSASRLLLT